MALAQAAAHPFEARPSGGYDWLALAARLRRAGTAFGRRGTGFARLKGAKGLRAYGPKGQSQATTDALRAISMRHGDWVMSHRVV